MDKLIEKWRARHAYPDVIAMWAASAGAEARELAFNAIAHDPQVLHRAVRLQAVKMATQAEDYAQALLAPSAAASDTLRAVTRFVLQSIVAWRDSLKAYARHPSEIGVPSVPATVPVPPPTSQGDPWEVALRNFPHVDDTTGRFATRLLHEFGISLLKRMHQPWDHVIILAVLRYTARLLRGGQSELEPGWTRATALDDIAMLQSYAEQHGLSPMLVGYTGRGKPAMQALGLWRDARTLLDAVSGSNAGEGKCASALQRAVDFHAFAVVAMNHHILLDLPLEDTYDLAAAANRQAAAAMRSPGMVAMPRLPDHSCAPDVVRLHARACLRPATDEPPGARVMTVLAAETGCA